MSSLIEASELLDLYKNENFILVDAGGGKAAKDAYLKSHLDKAQFVNLDTDLSDVKENPADGGRHPLPTLESFLETLSGLGIDQDSHVVIYDDKNGANSATRFWWMLKAIGHQKVQVLNGGLQAAEKSGLPMTDRIEKPTSAKPYSATDWQLPLADINEVEQISQDPKHLVIDVRSPERYRGETEPIDLVAGHIPGAINIPFATNLDDSGRFLPSEILKANYEKVIENRKTENVIVHCGSGVTACHTLFALTYAGFQTPKLYVGSWSEWSRNEKVIAKG